MRGVNPVSSVFRSAVMNAWKHATQRYRVWSPKRIFKHYIIPGIHDPYNPTSFDIDIYTPAHRISYVCHVFSVRRHAYVFRYHYLLNSIPISDPENFNVDNLYYRDYELFGFVKFFLGFEPSRKSIDEVIQVEAYQLLSRVLIEYRKRGYTLNDYMDFLSELDSRFSSAEWSRAFEFASGKQRNTLNLISRYCDFLKHGSLPGLEVSEDEFLRLPFEWQWEMLSAKDRESGSVE